MVCLSDLTTMAERGIQKEPESEKARDVVKLEVQFNAHKSIDQLNNYKNYCPFNLL